MKNILYVAGTTSLLNTPAVIPNELIDQAIKIVVSVVSVVLANWLSGLLKKKKE